MSTQWEAQYQIANLQHSVDVDAKHQPIGPAAIIAIMSLQAIAAYLILI